MCGGGGDKPEEMESRLALSQQAAMMLQRYGSTFVGLENQFMDTVQNQFSDANYDSSIAAGMNQAAAQYEPAIQDMRAAAFNRGFDPTSGAFQSESEALRGAKARGMGLAGADRGISNTDMGFAGLQNIVKMGQGLQTEAFQGQMDVASAASDRIRQSAQDDFARSSSLQNLAGTGVGMAAGYGMNPYRASTNQAATA